MTEQEEMAMLVIYGQTMSDYPGAIVGACKGCASEYIQPSGAG